MENSSKNNEPERTKTGLIKGAGKKKRSSKHGGAKRQSIAKNEVLKCQRI